MKRILLLFAVAFIFGSVMPTMAQQKKTPVKQAGNNSAAKFILGNGELGPLSIGQTVSSLPKSVAGLYDSFKYVNETYENEMEGEMETIEQCEFYKGGKRIFCAMTPNKKIESFELYEGSLFIQTADGIYVGYPARSLFTKYRSKKWTPPYYYGETCCVNGRYEYVMPVIIEGERTPSKTTDFSSNAKVTTIRHR